MLAVKRKVRANGRIRLLRASTKTIKLTKGVGVATGTKWHKKDLKELTQLKKIIPNQKEKERGKVTHKWEVKEKTWGKIAVKFIKNKRIKTDPMKEYKPFLGDSKT